ncbi:MAG: hypothetical protein II486_04140 [Thermoguttaceae bacterium]|nr:hypothetical protein [Thermoguttaceae bacterium]
MKLSNVFKGAAALAAAFLCVCAANVQAADGGAFSVDFTQKIGDVRPINGINLWANMSCETIEDRRPLAEACQFSTVRLHDAPWDNNGIRLVDVHQIFGNLDADPKDPKNYYFGPTDDYIRNILTAGAVPIYRLGTSIEHTATKYFAIKPADPEHYAEICAGIVRHYNAKWADGFEWNLPYWEIWNEPNIVPQMWDSDYESYCRFYVVVAKRLRAEFPNIKIGGPALAGSNLAQIKQLADLCKREGAPLDFLSWHCYARYPNELLDPPAEIRKTLDEAGFPDAELHLNEWHYFPTEWSVVHGTKGGDQAKRELSESPTGLHGAEAAAFVDFVLTRWLDTPLTMSNYYAFGLERWGLIDPYGKLRPTYFALKFFGELRTEAPKRVATADPGQYVSLLGAVSEDGSAKRLLVSVYKQDDAQTVEIDLKGVPEQGEVQVDYIDYDHDFASETVAYTDGKLKLNAQKSSVFLVRF